MQYCLRFRVSFFPIIAKGTDFSIEGSLQNVHVSVTACNVHCYVPVTVFYGSFWSSYCPKALFFFVCSLNHIFVGKKRELLLWLAASLKGTLAHKPPSLQHNLPLIHTRWLTETNLFKKSQSPTCHAGKQANMHAASLDDINLISDRSHTEAEQHLLPAKCETKKVSRYVYFIYPYEKSLQKK